MNYFLACKYICLFVILVCFDTQDVKVGSVWSWRRAFVKVLRWPSLADWTINNTIVIIIILQSEYKDDTRRRLEMKYIRPRVCSHKNNFW